MSRYKGERVKYTLRMPASLMRDLSRIAKERGIPVNDLILSEINKKLERDHAAQQNSERSA